MPEVGDYSRHLHGVDERLQRSSQQGWASRCFCGSGFRSELYNDCSFCHEIRQDDAKPEPKPALELHGSTEFQSPADNPPAPTPAIMIAPAGAPAPTAVALGPSPRTRVTRARSSASMERNQLARTSPRAAACSSSPYLRRHGQRGRPPNGSHGARLGFKGVRQRKGVRGFLVEIRPPKWKRTIWLGTYNSDREAAGAFDAGTFYTKKKGPYNFPALQGTFPPLPATLRLDNSDDSDEIKTFVQREAREAAIKVKSFPVVEAVGAAPPPPPPPPPSSSTRTDLSGPDPSDLAVCSSATSYSVDSHLEGLPNPADDVEWFYQQMIPDFLGWSSILGCDLKQEDLDLEPVDLGFIHSLP